MTHPPPCIILTIFFCRNSSCLNRNAIGELQLRTLDARVAREDFLDNRPSCDEEILEEIEKRNKLLAKFKKSKQPSDSQNYKIARNKVQSMIKKKEKNFVAEKLNQNIGKPKELWKSLKSLGLPSKQQSLSTICLEKDGTLSFGQKAYAEIFRDFNSNLADDLVKKLPSPLNKFGTRTVREYCKNLNLEEKSFAFEPTAHAVVLKLLEGLHPSKSAGLDNLAGKFLKEGASILPSLLTDLCN